MSERLTVKDNIVEKGTAGLQGLQYSESDVEKRIKELEERLTTSEFLNKNPNYILNQGVVSSALGNLDTNIPLYEDYGKSKYDKPNPTLAEYLDYADNRGQQQSTASKWLSGATKAVGLAASTFLSGIAGTIYGLGEAAIEGDASRILRNDLTEGLSSFNEKMEEWLPNYRTDAEKERPWWQNLGTANFWADTVLKNMGFTVGAMYGGGVMLAPLKALKLGSLSSRVIGTVGMGITEASVEGTNAGNEYANSEIQKLNDAFNKSYSEIMQSTEMTPMQKQMAVSSLFNNAKKAKEDIANKANLVANVDALGSFISTTWVDFLTFGKVFSGGFRNTKKIAENGIERAGTAATRDLAYNTVLKNPKKAAALGLAKGQLEGVEEMNQQWATNTAIDLYTPESPDFYYQMLRDEEYTEGQKEFMNSLTRGFMSSWGDGNQWEQYAVGALTGMLGVPIAGSRFTQADNTVGKGKKIGITGGFLGDYLEAKRFNENAIELQSQLQSAADKIQNTAAFAARSEINADLMSGYSAENKKFEFKNAEDNVKHEIINAFLRAGREDDLMELIDASSNNLSDEDLKMIAETTSNKQTNQEGGTTSNTGYIDALGNYDSDSAEGRQKMREEISRRGNELKQSIQDYKKSYEAVRGATKGVLPKDQEDELAWLYWKSQQFENRISDIITNNKEGLTNMQMGIQSFLHKLNSENKENTVDYKVASLYKSLIDEVLKAKDSKHAVSLLHANSEVFQDIVDPENIELFTKIAENEGIDIGDVSLNTTMLTNIQDLVKLADVNKTFNEKFKEYTEDPKKIEINRNKIVETIKNKKKERATKKGIDEIIENKNKPKIVLTALEKSGLSVDEFSDTVKEREDLTNEQKNDLLDAVQNASDFKNAMDITIEEVNDAISHNLSLSEEDKQMLINSYDQSLSDAGSIDELEAIKNTILEEAATQNADLAESFRDAYEKTEVRSKKEKQMPKKDNTASQNNNEESKAHDGTTPGTPVNTQQKNNKLEDPDFRELNLNPIDFDGEEFTKMPGVTPQGTVVRVSTQNTTRTAADKTIPTTTSKLPIHQLRGDNTPYYNLVKEGKGIRIGQNGKLETVGESNYTEQELKTMEVVYNYLQNKKAFDYVDSGKLKSGDTIYLGIDSTLEEQEVRTVVLLHKDSAGKFHVVGDITGNDRLYSVIKTSLSNNITGSNGEIKISSTTTVVSSVKSGKVAYTLGASNTLSDIFGKKSIRLGYVNKEGAVITRKPTTAQAQENWRGRPVIILEAPNGDLVIPINVKLYSEFANNKDNLIIQKIDGLINKIATSLYNNVMDAAKAKSEAAKHLTNLKSLLYLRGSDIFIDPNGPAVGFKLVGNNGNSEFHYTIPNSVEHIENFIKNTILNNNTRFNVSKTIISYPALTKAFGELATTNIESGKSKTVSDWFEINNPLHADNVNTNGLRIPKESKVNLFGTEYTVTYNSVEGITSIQDSSGTKLKYNDPIRVKIVDAFEVENNIDYDNNALVATRSGIYSKKLHDYVTNHGRTLVSNYTFNTFDDSHNSAVLDIDGESLPNISQFQNRREDMINIAYDYINNREFSRGKYAHLSEEEFNTIIVEVVQFISTLESNGYRFISSPIPMVSKYNVENFGEIKVAGYADFYAVDASGNVAIIMDTPTLLNSVEDSEEKEYILQYARALHEMALENFPNREVKILIKNELGDLNEFKTTALNNVTLDISKLVNISIEKTNNKLKNPTSKTSEEKNVEEGLKEDGPSIEFPSTIKASEEVKALFNSQDNSIKNSILKSLGNNCVELSMHKLKLTIKNIQKSTKKYETSDYNKEGFQILNDTDLATADLYTLEKIFNNGCTNDAQRILGNKVFAIAKKLGVKVQLNEQLAERTLGKYEDNTVFFSEYLTLDSNSALQSHVILHEIIHAVTSKVMEQHSKDQLSDSVVAQAADSLVSIYNKIKNDSNFKGEYAINSVEEMISELGNPKFRDKLKQQSLWQKIINAIKSLFGFSNNSLDSSAIKALNVILDNYDYTKILKSKDSKITNKQKISQLPKKIESTVIAWLKNNKELDFIDYANILNYINNNFKDNNQKLAAGWWISKNAVRLKEDDFKITRASQLLKNNKDDFMRYNNPMEVINKYEKSSNKSAYINPKYVPTLHLNKSFPEHGIEIYDVDESKESRKNLREILNSHLGKRTSPWCLLQGDDEGNLQENSIVYWDRYNAYPKQVAFKNGKVIAFSANNKSDKVWWDLQDEPNTTITLTHNTKAEESNKIIVRKESLDINTGNLVLTNIKQIEKINNIEKTTYYDNSNNITHATIKDSKSGKLIKRFEYLFGKCVSIEDLENNIYAQHVFDLFDFDEKDRTHVTIPDSENGTTTYEHDGYPTEEDLNENHVRKHKKIEKVIRNLKDNINIYLNYNLSTVSIENFHHTIQFNPDSLSISGDSNKIKTIVNKANKMLKFDTLNIESINVLKNTLPESWAHSLVNAMLYWKRININKFESFKQKLLALKNNNLYGMDKIETNLYILALNENNINDYNRKLHDLSIEDIENLEVPRYVLDIDINVLNNVFNNLNTTELGFINESDIMSTVKEIVYLIDTENVVKNYIPMTRTEQEINFRC